MEWNCGVCFVFAVVVFGFGFFYLSLSCCCFLFFPIQLAPLPPCWKPMFHVNLHFWCTTIICRGTYPWFQGRQRVINKIVCQQEISSLIISLTLNFRPKWLTEHFTRPNWLALIISVEFSPCYPWFKGSIEKGLGCIPVVIPSEVLGILPKNRLSDH